MTEQRSSLPRARQMFDQLTEAIRATRDSLDENLDAAVDIISNLESILILTGLGKSGLIAQKAAATLSSTGTQTAFVHPVEALHGDLGIVKPGSAMLALSKSGGNTETIDFARQFKSITGGTVITITEPGSKLANVADIPLVIPVLAEIDDYDLVPTTSTLTTLAICDVLAILVQQRKGLDDTDFARFHPSGTLGRRLSLRVEDLMIGDERLPLVQPSAGFADLLFEITSKSIGMAVLESETHEYLGVITDADIRRLLLRGEDVTQLSTAECFERSRRGSESQAPTHVKGVATPDTMAIDCLTQMQDNQISELVILENQRVVGVVRLRDLVAAGI